VPPSAPPSDPASEAAPGGIQLYPSLLAADPWQLGRAVTEVEGVIDWLHIDVMDYHFVPNLAYSPATVQAVASHSSVPLDCHLMIEQPERWALSYVEAGASSVTFHAEAVSAPVRTARELHGAGARAGIAFNPGTAVKPYAELFSEFDMVLVMTIEPGFGGQPFLTHVLPTIAAVRRLAKGRELDLWIQVDGGVTEETAVQCVEAGANVLVAGSAVFGAADPAAAAKRIRAAAEGAITSPHVPPA
jgi:ribulose-phosphate 3-epimerase